MTGEAPADPERGGGRGAGTDRFARIAASYDAWIDWGPRLAKEMPFLLGSLRMLEGPGSPGAQDSPAGRRLRILDVGCGTGAHAIALVSAGYAVTGLDLSPTMLDQARAAEKARGGGSSGGARAPGERPGTAQEEAPDSMGSPSGPGAVEWIQGDIREQGGALESRYDAALALGSALLSVGDEEEEVTRALLSMIRTIRPGGMLLLQVLNPIAIRRTGRISVKGSGAEATPQRIWLRHHFEVGDGILFHSYVLTREGATWSAEVERRRVVDLPPERLLPMLRPHFERIGFFDTLSGRPFEPERSDALGVRALGRR